MHLFNDITLPLNLASYFEKWAICQSVRRRQGRGGKEAWVGRRAKQADRFKTLVCTALSIISFPHFISIHSQLEKINNNKIVRPDLSLSTVPRWSAFSIDDLRHFGIWNLAPWDCWTSALWCVQTSASGTNNRQHTKSATKARSVPWCQLKSDHDGNTLHAAWSVCVNIIWRQHLDRVGWE